MEQKKTKKRYVLLKIIAAVLIFVFLILYAYSFPKTMELLDKKINEIIVFMGLDFEISLFSDFSVFANKAVNMVQYFYETVKSNLKSSVSETEPLPIVIFSCAGEFPLEKVNITSAFGKRNDPISGNIDIHSGMDIAAELGSDVTASWSGKVAETGYDEIYGKYIILQHSEEFFSKYCHLSKICVSEKEFVNAKEKIGEAGSTGRSTGNHLHFEVEVNNRKIDPMECFEF